MKIFTNVNAVTIWQNYTTDVIFSHIISYHGQLDNRDIVEVIDGVIFGPTLLSSEYSFLQLYMMHAKLRSKQVLNISTLNPNKLIMLIT